MTNYTTMVIDMAQIWPKYGWDVEAVMVAKKIGILYAYYYECKCTNFTIFLKCTNMPKILPIYCWLLSDYISDDDIIHLFA